MARTIWVSGLFSQRRWSVLSLLCSISNITKTGSHTNLLIKHTYRNWKDARSDMDKHSTLEYHMQSMARMRSFIETGKPLEARVDTTLTTDSAAQVHNKMSRAVWKAGCCTHTLLFHLPQDSPPTHVILTPCLMFVWKLVTATFKKTWKHARKTRDTHPTPLIASTITCQV